MSDWHHRAASEALPRCFWLDSPDRPAPLAPLERDDEADLAIVGGGFTGLWAAVLAKERAPNRDVVLLESQRIAEGASGRNGGFVDVSLTHGILNGIHHFPDEAKVVHELGVQNLHELVASLERLGIDARYEGNGKLDVAAAPYQVEGVREHLEAYQRFGMETRWLDREATRAELDSPLFEAATFVQPSGIVDPARLCWGLRDAAIRLGVRIHEQTPVQGLRRAGACIDVRTEGGRVRARHALLATNAYRSPLRRTRLFTIPVWDYVLMTEPLDAAQRASIGWARRQGVGDSGNQFHYFRLTHDDRILWGGYDAIYGYGSSTSPAFEARHATYAALSRHFFETFPQLEGLRFSHRWAGCIATTSRFCLNAGRAMGGRVAWAGGYTGLGVAASRFGARVALDLLDGIDAPHLRIELVRKRSLPWPPEPLRYLAVQLTRHELARADRNGGRRGIWLELLDRLKLGYDS